MTKKKVLILSASIGTGHTQAARAIEEYVKTIPEECEVEHLDFLSNDVLSIDNIVKETYIKILDVFPMLYDLMYYSSQGYKKGLVVKTLFAWGLKRRMLKVLAEKKPDVLVFTHPFPAGAAALLKRQHRLDIPLVGSLRISPSTSSGSIPRSTSIVSPLRSSRTCSSNRASLPIRSSYRASPCARPSNRTAGIGMRLMKLTRTSSSWAAAWAWGPSSSP